MARLRIKCLLIVAWLSLLGGWGHPCVAQQPFAQEVEIFNDVWDKANHWLRTTPAAAATQPFAQTIEILNDVWDQPNHRLRTNSAAGGGVAAGDSPTWTGVHTFSPVTSLSAAGTSTILGSAQTITLTGPNPTTYATIDAVRWNSPTLVGTNPGQTVTLGSTLSVVGPIKSTNVAATELVAVNVPSWSCGAATACKGIKVVAPIGGSDNMAATFVGRVDMQQTGPTSSNWRLLDNTGVSQWQPYLTSGNLIFFDQGADRIVFKQGGGLGIGVTPTTALPAGITYGATAFASLGTPDNGTVAYCNNCTVANPCASGGTGAIAKRLNGAWVCN